MISFYQQLSLSEATLVGPTAAVEPLLVPNSTRHTPSQNINLCSFQLWATFSPAIPLADIFLPALPSDCFAIDFPRRAISPGEGLLILFTSR